jgi:beta-xylosidase
MKFEIQNKTPRLDVDGDVIDAHDGCLEFYDGVFYLYGTVYGDTNGYSQLNYYTCYSSPDLKNWRGHGDILPLHKPAVRFRPYVKRCPATSQFVLWYYQCARWAGTTDWAAGDGPVSPFQFAVAVSESPTGPFRTINANVPVKNVSGGDHNLFVDRDGTGYLIYTSNKNKFAVTVEKLAPDFLSSTMESSEVIAEQREAPGLFRRGDFYYALVGNLCCFCPQGASVEVFRARHPLGPYEYRRKINHDSEGRIVIPAQQTHVAQLGAAEDGPLIWMGDCWESTRDGIKGQDIQYWSPPLQFDENDDPLPLTWQDGWSI